MDGHLEDQKIIQKLNQGDESGYRELFDRYYTPLCIYGLRYIDSFATVEDIVQDIFVKFWDMKTHLYLRTSLKSYLFKAVKNNCINFCNTNKKYHFDLIEDHIDHLLTEEVSIEEIEALKDKLLKEIDELPEKSRETFKAIVFENLKYKEAAERFGVSVNTIKTHFSRALKQLRQMHSNIIILLLFGSKR